MVTQRSPGPNEIMLTSMEVSIQAPYSRSLRRYHSRSHYTGTSRLHLPLTLLSWPCANFYVSGHVCIHQRTTQFCPVSAFTVSGARSAPPPTYQVPGQVCMDRSRLLALTTYYFKMQDENNTWLVWGNYCIPPDRSITELSRSLGKLLYSLYFMPQWRSDYVIVSGLAPLRPYIPAWGVALPHLHELYIHSLTLLDLYLQSIPKHENVSN